MSTPRSADPKPKPGPPQQKARRGRPAPQERRALTHIGGATLLEGDPEGAAKLAHALDVASSSTAEEAARAHVHGFHSYPARMHPDTARRLIEGLSRPGERVLDPFCGSGTVLVEARLAGRAAIGVDANPLAVRLARLKVQGSTPGERERLVAAAREVAAAADERRKARAGPSRRYGPEDVALFEPHVLLELDGLRVGLDRIAGHGADALRADLELVLSAILTKLSRRTSDTSEHELPRRIAAGYPARLFLRKAEELAQRLAEVAAQLEASPPALVEEETRACSAASRPARSTWRSRRRPTRACTTTSPTTRRGCAGSGSAAPASSRTRSGPAGTSTRSAPRPAARAGAMSSAACSPRSRASSGAARRSCC